MFFKQWKINKAVARAVKSFAAGQDLSTSLQGIDALAENDQLDALIDLGRRLRQEELFDEARAVLACAVQRSPSCKAALVELAEVEIDDDDPDQAVLLLKKAVELDSNDDELACRLADLLLEGDDFEQAIATLKSLGDASPAVMVSLARALAAQDQVDEALSLAATARERLEHELKNTMHPEAWQQVKDRYDEATRLWSDLLAETQGAESVVEAEAAGARLDARAGVNYRLLGAAVAARSERVATNLRLESAERTEARAKQMLAAERSSAHALSLLGCARLRLGSVGEAKDLFNRARKSDPEFFPALFGLGAALDHDRWSLIARSKRLPEPFQDSKLGEVVSDWPELTERERRIVCASAGPLRPLLGNIAAAGAQMKILPIDVRATDLSELADLAGLREADDHRSYDAITGLAEHRLAVARIEELGDITSSGWTFAHELGHLAYFHMPERWREPFLELYDRACDDGYSAIEYAQKNPDEFFACGYTDFLCWKYDLGFERELDDAGVLRGLFDAFESLGRSLRD